MKLSANFSLSALKEKILISRAQVGDGEAFGKLYMAYLDQIFRYVFFRVNQEKELAEDITEDIFVKAMDKLKSFKTQKGTFKAWVYAIARNQITDFFRKNKKEIFLDEMISSQNVNLEEALIKKYEMNGIAGAIKKLPKTQKEVVILTYINGLSNSEVSKLLGKGEQALRAIKYRALKNLKRGFHNHD